MTRQPNIDLMEAIKTVVTEAYQAQYSPQKALGLVRDIYLQYGDKGAAEREPVRFSREFSK